MTASSNASRILVIGGGFAGLSTAARLAQMGLPVTVFEQAGIGYAASTQNQGWLYSGAWFAREDVELAGVCYEAMKQTEAFCPACVEDRPHGRDEFQRMVFFTSKGASPVDEWTDAWEEAGIPYEELDVSEVETSLPDVDQDRVASAFRLPDRAFRPAILLEHLAATAENHGAEIRLNTPVEEIVVHDRVAAGLRLESGEEVLGRLIIDATGAFNHPYWSERLRKVPKIPSDGRELRLLKTHVVACEANLKSAPFCVLDVDGFNFLPHGSSAVFGSAVWQRAKSADAVGPDAERLDRLWQLVQAFLPGTYREDASGVREWAGVTAIVDDSRHDPRKAPWCHVIDHQHSQSPLGRVISIYPGRATLWARLADDVSTVVCDLLDHECPTASPSPWELPHQAGTA